MCFLCNDTEKIYTPAQINITRIIDDWSFEIKENKQSIWMNVHNCPICSENKPYIIKFD